MTCMRTRNSDGKQRAETRSATTTFVAIAFGLAALLSIGIALNSRVGRRKQAFYERVPGLDLRGVPADTAHDARARAQPRELYLRLPHDSGALPQRRSSLPHERQTRTGGGNAVWFARTTSELRGFRIESDAESAGAGWPAGGIRLEKEIDTMSRQRSLMLALLATLLAFAVAAAQETGRKDQQKSRAGQGQMMSGEMSMDKMMKQCREHCQKTSGSIDNLSKQIDQARQSNDVAKMRAALDQAQQHLTEMKSHMSGCMNMMNMMEGMHGRMGGHMGGMMQGERGSQEKSKKRGPGTREQNAAPPPPPIAPALDVSARLNRIADARWV